MDEVLGLDAGRMDLRGPGAPAGRAAGSAAGFTGATAAGQLLGWLLAGRPCGPVFLTDRRAPGGPRPGDVCPVTGRARMSYRRAAEIFTAATRPLDPAGRGWTLGQLRQASEGRRRRRLTRASGRSPRPAGRGNADVDRARGAPVLAVVAGQESLVDQVLRARRDRGRAWHERIHHALGVAHARLEPLRHGVEQQPAPGQPGRDRDDPAVADEYPQPVAGEQQADHLIRVKVRHGTK